MDIQKQIKLKFIFMMFLWLLIVPNASYATIYFYFDAEDGTVGNDVPNPPFCQTECTGKGSKSTYQSSGGAPQGTKYFQWQTYDLQPDHYTWITGQGLPITNIIGKTFYLAFFFNFTRINGLDIWHETGQSGDKGMELLGTGVRWEVGRGQWECLPNNQDHHYTTFVGNATYHLNPNIECVSIYVPNQNGYSGSNSMQHQYEQWYSAVFAIKMASDNTGSITLWIDGIKYMEYNNIKTAADNTATISGLREGGSIAQPAYDAPAHYRKFDALMLTDNWQDIINGGYLKGGSDSTPPPSDGNLPPNNSGGDTSASGGGGCGFVKDDGKGQGTKGEGVSMMILLIIALKIISVTLRRLERRRALW